MSDTLRVVEVNSEAELAALARHLRDWEPRLDLHRPPRDARLFEPDGTLYAVAMGDGMSVTTERCARTLRRGDLVVVPQGVALDIEPAVDLIGIRHDGPPPDHFRERFIQIWGFEHIPAPPPAQLPTGTAALAEVIAAEDVRFRLAYAVLDLHEGALAVERTGLETLLWIGLAGEPRLSLPDQPGAHLTLQPGMLAAIGPGTSFRVEGNGRLGRLSLATEIAHEARRRDRERAGIAPPSPEYHPAPPRPESS